MRVLVVTNPFGEYAKGATISDPTKMAEILGGEHAHHVVQAEHEDATIHEQE